MQCITITKDIEKYFHHHNRFSKNVRTIEPEDIQYLITLTSEEMKENIELLYFNELSEDSQIRKDFYTALFYSKFFTLDSILEREILIGCKYKDKIFLLVSFNKIIEEAGIELTYGNMLFTGFEHEYLLTTELPYDYLAPIQKYVLKTLIEKIESEKQTIDNIQK